MKTAVFAYTRRGRATAGTILEALEDAEAYTIPRFAEGRFLPLPSPAAPLYERCFRDCGALIFVGAAGIAVRSVAPCVRSKTTDPAVLCVDEQGRYVIPLLSGHIGGANALAKRLAELLGATAVVTTATDGRGRFSVDRWAAEGGYIIDSMAAAKAVSAAILEEDVPLCCPLPVAGELPPGLVYGSDGPLGIFIGWERKRPFETTLRLIPPALRLGIGCRKGVGADAIRAAVDAVMDEHRLDPRAVKCAASIDLKAREPGLLEYCEARGWPLQCYSPERLRAATGDFTPSEFVASVTGVDNVCERAALLGAERLLVRKTALAGVTVAVAAEQWEVRFG